MAGLAAIWLTVVIRKVATGSVPGLLVISAVVLTVQTALVLATGELWLFLLQFPLANLCMCVLFARTASGPRPLARAQTPLRSRLNLRVLKAGEVIEPTEIDLVNASGLSASSPAWTRSCRSTATCSSAGGYAVWFHRDSLSSASIRRRRLVSSATSDLVAPCWPASRVSTSWPPGSMLP